MASGLDKSDVETDMITLVIKFVNIGKKFATFRVRIRQSSCIRDLKDHLKASRGIIGKLKKGNKELSDGMTLAEAGITSGMVFRMESHTPAKQFDYNISVKSPNGAVINIQVNHRTMIEDLKHKIQDEIGMPVEQQILEYNGRSVNQSRAPVLEICGYKKTPIVVKWKPCKLE